MFLFFGGFWGVGPDAADEADAASMRRTSLAPNDAGALVGVLSSPPVSVTMSDVDEVAAAAPSACAFSSDSLFLFLRRRSLAAFLALFLAFSILFCLLSDRTSAEVIESGAKASDEAAPSPPADGRAGPALGEASDGAAFGSLFPLLLFRPLAASGFLSETERIPVSDAVSGIERTPATIKLEPEDRASSGAVRDCRPAVAAARCTSSF